MSRADVIDMLSSGHHAPDLAVEFVQEHAGSEDADTDAFWSSMTEEEIRAAFDAYASF